MTWNEFYKSVKDGSFESIYCFTGPEAYNKREALAALRRACLPAGLEQLNEVTLEGVSAQTIIDSAETYPVMCPRRLTIVRDWKPLMPGTAKDEEADVERMLGWLDNAPDTSIVVFYMTESLDARKKLGKKLCKLPGFIQFDYLSGATLAKWCAQQLKPLGKTIASDAVTELTAMAGQDLSRLSGELKKLAAYVEDEKQIGVADVRRVVSPSPEYTVFMIMDHLLTGRLAEATAVANTMLQAGSNAMGLISMLENQLRIDTHLKLALSSGGSVPEASRLLGIKEGRAYFAAKQIRSISAEALKARYMACFAADYDVKSGKLNDRAALNALMLKIVKAPR